jgi:MFS family permease
MTETMDGIGLIAGPAVGGILFQFGGFQLPFTVFGILLLMATCAAIIFIAHDEQSSWKFLIEDFKF